MPQSRDKRSSSALSLPDAKRARYASKLPSLPDDIVASIIWNLAPFPTTYIKDGSFSDFVAAYELMVSLADVPGTVGDTATKILKLIPMHWAYGDELLFVKRLNEANKLTNFGYTKSWKSVLHTGFNAFPWVDPECKTRVKFPIVDRWPIKHYTPDNVYWANPITSWPTAVFMDLDDE